MQAFSLSGEHPIQIGGSFAFLSWSMDGRSVLLGGSYFVPLAVGEVFPQIPAGGFRSVDEMALLPGARRIDEAGCNASLYFPLAKMLFLKLSSSWREAIVIGPSIAQADPVRDVSAEAFPS